MNLNWNTVYILAYYGIDNKKIYATTWDDDAGFTTIDVVITGINEHEVPFWDSAVPETAMLHAIPEGKTAEQYSKEINGIHAIAWYFKRGFDRNI